MYKAILSQCYDLWDFFYYGVNGIILYFVCLFQSEIFRVESFKLVRSLTRSVCPVFSHIIWMKSVYLLDISFRWASGFERICSYCNFSRILLHFWNQLIHCVWNQGNLESILRICLYDLLRISCVLFRYHIFNDRVE